ncbi:MAG: 30S ribosomal protein S12 methylthiotransferase RimO [Termitinemataceae bacterium]
MGVKRFFVDPHGCAKNQVDGETLISVLQRSGWVYCTDPEEADLLIINSCGFIESAKRESIEAVLSYKSVYPDKKILLAGCLAQRYGQQLAEELTEADAFFGNTDLSRIAEAAERAIQGQHSVLLPPLDATGKADFALCSEERPLLSLPGSAYVKITEGCDNHCTYCSIPLIRGNLRSRPIDSIVSECKGLLHRGVRELCLIGQDLGSYGKDGAAGTLTPGECRLSELLTALSALKGEFWIRLLYIHPDNFPQDILPICQRDPRILPYFDIPFQHGSERILRMMNRRGNKDIYLSLLDTIRSALPDATIRSTFLVGFPGETETDMEILLDFQQKAQLDWLGVFTYSREEDTPAYTFKDRVPKRVAAERKSRIESAQGPITEQRMQRFVGKKLPVLVEEKVENEEGLYIGRTLCQAPEVDGATVITSDVPLTPGDIVTARVFARSGIDLDSVYMME